ncbi:MAG: restriction endonuclease subunit S [Negativicoccus succinicivorans]|nr:restriction endonuclease subunit S [Negativicoccus succinicivorans]
MERVKKVPAIRFKGFDDEWIRVSVDEVCDVSNGNMDTQDADASGIYPFFIRSEEVMKSNKYLYDEEAILTPGEGKIGEIFHYVNGKYAAHQRVYRLFNFSKCISPTFLIYTLKNSFKNHALKNSSTATAPSIRKGTITDFCFKTCLLEEQTQIGNFLKNLDEKLELEKEKHEKLKIFKKAMLEDMFPKEGKKVPKVRLEGFDDEWGKCKIGNMLKYEQPASYIVNSDKYKSSGTPVLTANKAFILGYTNEGNVYNKGNCIIFDDFTMDFKYVDFDFKVKSSALKILTSQSHFLYFIYVLLCVQNFVSKAHRRHYIGYVQKLDVLIPSPEEQFQIGNFFKNLDEKITLSEKKIAKIENFKKAMLEKMFV